MQKFRSRKAMAGLIAAAVVLGGGVAAVTPAGAEVADAAATNWKKIWKKNLKPLADKRYYTKKQSNAKYSTKTETSTLLGNYYTKAQSDASYYTKAQSDANYYKKADVYTKTESDAKYAPYPTLMRGTVMMAATAAAAGGAAGAEISYGVTLAAAPTVHYIPVGGVPPAGCSGNAQAPNAQSGHLCVFAGAEINTGSVGIFTITGGGGSNTMGAVLVARSAGAGEMIAAGSWAFRPGTLAVLPLLADATAPKVGTFGG